MRKHEGSALIAGDSGRLSRPPGIDALLSLHASMLADRHERIVWNSPTVLFSLLSQIGQRGYFADAFLWKLRTLLAPVIIAGGRPGDRARPLTSVGDVTDYWRVAAIERDRRLALVCAMRGLGEARIEWLIEARPGGRSLLVQTASFTPSGSLGSAYWTMSLLPHRLLMKRLLRGIALAAERAGEGPPSGRPTRGLRIIRRDIVVARPLHEAFDFFADARNLEAITPPWLNFQITTPTPIAMEAGARIDYRIRLHGIPVGWQTRIEAWEPDVRFVDRQIRGPYRWWYHEHRFEAVGTAATRVIDEVEYASPLRWVSEPLIVRRDVERIFDYRSDALRELLGASRAAALQPALQRG